MTAQLQTPNTTNWAELDFLLQQAARTRVSMLVLVGVPASDRGLKALKDYNNLQALDLFPMGSELTEDGFKSIAALSKLRELNLTFVNEDRGLELMAPLKGMKSVRKLALRAPELKQIPQPLRSWTGLTSIELTGKDIEGIKSLKGLTSVSLVHSELSRKSAEEVVSLPGLTNFELHSTLFPPSLLKQLSKLERLNLTADSPEGVTFLIDAAGGLKQLKTLEVSVARLLGEDLLGLRESKIDTLVINGGLDDEADVAVLAKLKSVRSLTLANIDGFNNTSIRALAAPRTLSKLNVVLSSSKASLKEAGALAALSEFSYLFELNVREGGMRKVQQLGLNKFAGLKTLSLEKLNLGVGVTAEIVNCPKLETLSLAGSLLPQNEIAKLANIATLKVLDLRGCLTVRAEEIEAFKSARAGCTVLR